MSDTLKSESVAPSSLSAQEFEEWKNRYSLTDDFLVGDVWEVAQAAWNAARGGR
jgi:hypothetical protein